MSLLKRVVFVSFFSVIFLHSAHVESGAKIERYYTGIGAQFFTFGKDTLAWETSNLKYDNHDGKFTGLIVFSRLLKNGPAENAGIQAGDILLEIDSQKISVTDPENITKTFLRGAVGNSVLVKVRNAGTSGEREITITLTRIDRAAWVLQNYPMGEGMQSGNTSAAFQSKVHENKTIGKFVYWYNIKNTGATNILISWDLLNRVTSQGRGIENILFLKPNEAKEFIVETDEFPDYLGGQATVYKEADDWYVDFLKEGGTTVTKEKIWHISTGAAMPGFVPANWFMGEGQ